MAVTEPCWLKAEIPQEVRAHWADYPAMTTIESNKRVIADGGFKPVGNFVLPDSAWWDDYYDPMEQRLLMLRDKYRECAARHCPDRPGATRAGRPQEIFRLLRLVFFVMQGPA